jgi:RNA polymerase sigma-70 factor (ECF subfamily)
MSDMRPTELPEDDDRSLARAVLERGDERAFRTLYRRHAPSLYAFALRVLAGSEADAEDVVQETWVRAVRHLGNFRWESTLRTWLTSITLNLSREALRAKSRRDTTELDETLGLATPVARDGERIDLERAIARLPERCRTVLVLHDVEGFTHEEISRQLEIAVGTSKSQLFDARRAIRQYLIPKRLEMPHA